MPKKLIRCMLVFLIVCSGLGSYAVVAAANQENSGVYTVKNDDTLYSIAWQFGLDYRVIAVMNHLHAPYDIAKGQQLLLVEPGHTAPPGLGNPPVIIKHLPASYQASAINHTTAPVAATKPVAAIGAISWTWPTSGKVIKTYSLNTTPVNKGIDITGNTGQAIVAAASGDVVYSGNGIPGYGNLIILKHNADYLTAYAHNEKLLVKEGQTIQKGQKIALMGVGNFSTPDLHFEIRYRGQPVNPLGYLPKP